ncbi:MAG: DUF2946 domain-containing protein [Aquabacterium sp.]|nr:DUF2946 domain-containing protein [Aquabacterium sp.]
MALVAILLMALAPTLSHALQNRDAAHWAEVCTAQGTRWVDASGAPAGNPAGAHTAPAQVFEHCLYCNLHTGDAALPPAPAAVPLQVAASAVPRLFLAAPRTLHVWRAAQPRAPPKRC